MLALETTKTEIVAHATQSGRDMDARYAENYEVRQAFFNYFFVIADCPPESRVPKRTGATTHAPQVTGCCAEALVIWKIVRRHFGRRSKHVVASNRRAP